MMKKVRLDVLLVEKGLAPSREKAQALILAGKVTLNGQVLNKPGQQLNPEAEIVLAEDFPYVSRGGAKLAQALRVFPVDVKNKIALDIGASTGGFTDCLLQAGARKVYAVDVNTKQLDWKLLQNPKVVPVEKNARYLEPEDLPEKPDLTVIDVSFISVLKILPAVRKIMTAGDLVVLIKPQFEAGREQVGKKGVIRDKKIHQQVLTRVLSQAQEEGFIVKGLAACQTLGQRGNQEFLAWLQPGNRPLDREALEKIIQETLTDGSESEN